MRAERGVSPCLLSQRIANCPTADTASDPASRVSKHSASRACRPSESAGPVPGGRRGWQGRVLRLLERWHVQHTSLAGWWPRTSTWPSQRQLIERYSMTPLLAAKQPNERQLGKGRRRSALLLVLVAVGTVLVNVCVVETSYAAVEVCQRMTIPAYFAPGATWTKAISGGSSVGIMIMNPHSGPGTSRDTSYATYVNSTKAAGVKVLGYVHTSYTHLRAHETVLDL